MATSLAQQLQKLATPQTDVFRRKDTVRPSILFDPKEAAGFDRETFFDIGVSGIQELEKLNPVFAEYSGTLFSPKAQHLERSVQDTTANKALNKTITKFFLHLSPYFLLKSAHKALEWLVYRYHIHEYNKTEMMMLILPYHETNIFVRCLQLMDISKKNDCWHWLESLQRPGVQLAKSVLFTRCASDAFLFKFIISMPMVASKYVESYLTSLTTLYSFICTTIVGTIKQSFDVNETQIAGLLNVITAGIASTVPDFSAASLVIAAQTVQKTTLSDKCLDGILRKLTSDRNNLLREEKVMLICLICESQPHVCLKPSSGLVKDFLTSHWILPHVSRLVDLNFQVKQFLALMVRGLMNLLRNNENYDQTAKALTEIVENVPFSDEETFTLILEIILSKDASSKSTKTKKNSKALHTIGNLIGPLERRYPTWFDSTMQVLRQKDDIRKQLNVLENRMRDMSGSVRFARDVHSSSPAVRAQAVRHLIEKYDQIYKDDIELLKSSIAERIKESDPVVVSAVLELSYDRLLNLLGEEALTTALTNILLRFPHKRAEWRSVLIKSLKYLCSSTTMPNESFLAVLLYLFPLNDEHLAFATEIVNSNYARACIFLNRIRIKLNRAETASEMCEIVESAISQGKHLPSAVELLNVYENVPLCKASVEVMFFATVLVVHSLPEKCDVKLGLQVAHTLLDTLGSDNTKSTPIIDTNFIQTSLANGFHNAVIIGGLMKCLKVLLKRVGSLHLNKWLDLTNPSDEVKFATLFAEKTLKCCTLKKNKGVIFQNVLVDFLKINFPEAKDRLWFFSNFFVVHEAVSNELRVSSISFCKQVLESNRKLKMEMLTLDSPFVPSLLSAMTSPLACVRELAISLIETVSEKCPQSEKYNYVPLIAQLQKHKDEIVLDADQISMILYIVLGSNYKYISKIKEALINEAIKLDTPIHISSSIVSLLALNSTWDVFTHFTGLGLRILKRNDSSILNTSETSRILRTTIQFLNPSIAEKIDVDQEAWEFIVHVLKSDHVRVADYDGKQIPLPCLLLKQLNNEVYGQLSPHVQSEILSLVVEIVALAEDSNVNTAANSTIKKIEIDCSRILGILYEMRDVKCEKAAKNQKSRMVRVRSPTIEVLKTTAWKKGLTLLEFIQNKKKLLHAELLLPVLFQVLKKCLDFMEQASLEYPKQLILSSILHCCNKIDLNSLPDNAFNVELVVQCIRASQNPQTHHHALIVLANLASVIPEQVLHHTIAIFTFMGSSVLRHDDSYSFQIISKIIDTVVPIMTRDTLQEEGVKATTTSVLRVFVDAILDIPEHRRFHLFKKLLSTLGVKTYFWIFLLLNFEAQVVHYSEEKQAANKIDRIPRRLDIAKELLLAYPPDVIVHTCLQLLEYVKQLPVEKELNKSYPEIVPLTFNIEKYAPKQLRHYKYTIITFLSEFLSSPQLVNNVAALDEEHSLQMEPIYKNLIVHMLTHIRAVAKTNEEASSGPHAHYWKVMLHHTYDILDSINALLTNRMFLLVIKGLMIHDIPTVRRKAMELLNAKLQASTFDSNYNADLYALLPPLFGVIKSIPGAENEPDDELNQQTALITIKLLVKFLVDDYPDKFKQILEFVADLMKDEKMQGNILASLVLCVGELCANLRAHAIPSLGKVMPAFLRLLKTPDNSEAPDLIVLSVIIAIQKVVDALPLFMSTYLQKLLTNLSCLSAKWSQESDDQKVITLIGKLKSIQQKIAFQIPSRVLIPAVKASYETLLDKERFDGIKPLMVLLSEHLSASKGAEISAFLPELTGFILEALQLRADKQADFVMDRINAIEDNVIDALVALVLKLSESTFRPLYYRLYDWATRGENITDRTITFYRLSEKMSRNLKSLFVLFAGHFVKNAATVLNSCNSIKSQGLFFEDDDKKILLLESVLTTLLNVFTYDSQNFVNKERFETLIQPLVDQLENTLGGDQCSEERCMTLVIPCISQFAVATANDTLWKQLNYQILLKTRHSSSGIRLIGLNCLCEVVNKLGEDFLPLLPETIPFIAELLEDEDETVEKACQKAVQDLEKILGEPIKKYL